LFSVDSLQRIDLLAGDYDLDNDVDQADFDKWISTFGSTAELVADGNRDGVVDAADYTVWRDHLVPLPSTAGRASVPEPSISLLVLLGGCGFLLIPIRWLRPDFAS